MPHLFQSDPWIGADVPPRVGQLNRDDKAVKETRTKTVCNLLMKIPKFSKLKATYNSRFSNYAPESWNSLPLVRYIDIIVSFKSKLKNYLYDQL